MTPQEIFDKVVNHLRAQNSKAMGPNTEVHGANTTMAYRADKMICMYRAPDGKKCAAGCLIQDDEYSEWMEGISMDGVIYHPRCPPSLYERLREHLNLIAWVQSIHDTNIVDQWESSLEFAARRFNLTYTPKDA